MKCWRFILFFLGFAPYVFGKDPAVGKIKDNTECKQKQINN